MTSEVQDQVDQERGADQHDGDQDLGHGPHLEPGAVGVASPDHSEASDEAQDTLMREVSRDVESGGPHEQLTRDEDDPEQEADEVAGVLLHDVHCREHDDCSSLTVTTGHPGTSLTGERCLEESGVDTLLSHPPVWSLTLQDPLAILRSSNKRRFEKKLREHLKISIF